MTAAIPGAEGLRFVFVVGCQRSGTTLTGQILGAHPNAIFLDEIEGGQRWLDAAAAGDEGADALFVEALAGAGAKYRAPVDRFVERGGAMQPAPHVTHLIVKGLNSVYDSGFFRRFGSDVRIVFPIRDPRAVVASLMRVWRMPFVARQTRLAAERVDASDEWRATVERIAAEETPHHRKRALLWRLKNATLEGFRAAGFDPFAFRYEDLIDDPERVVPGIAEAAGLGFDPAMLAHSGDYRGRGPGGTARDRAIDAASLDRANEWLTARQQVEVVAEAEPIASAFGYRIADPVARPKEVDPPPSPPIVLTGRGGSGTRILSAIARATGLFLGNQLNESGDSREWVDHAYSHAIAATERAMDRIDMLPPALPEAFRWLARDILARSGAERPRWGWKLPENMLILPEILAAFPDARLVQIVRHPVSMALRDTHITSRDANPVGAAVLAAGYRALGIARPEGEEWLDNAVSWEWQVGRVARAGRAMGSARYYELRYEDFCRDPLGEGRRVAAFLDAPLDEALLPEPRPAPFAAPARDDPRVARIWEICGETAALLGYGKRP